MYKVYRTKMLIAIKRRVQSHQASLVILQNIKEHSVLVIIHKPLVSDKSLEAYVNAYPLIPLNQQLIHGTSS